MPFAINRHGQRVYFEVFGDQGPAALLLMGIGVSSRMWFETPKRLASDKTRPRRIVVLDNRGTGQSDRTSRPFRMADLADDAAAVLDAAAFPTADVLGISFGGMIAQELALRHPDRVSGLALLCTTPGLPLGTPWSPTAVAVLVQGFAKGLDGAAFERLMAPEHRLEGIRKAREKSDWSDVMQAERVETRTLLLHLLASALHSTGKRLGSIRCPTLVVSGEADELISPENSRRLARAIPNATLELLPDVGHDILSLEPERVAKSLAWIDRTLGR